MLAYYTVSFRLLPVKLWTALVHFYLNDHQIRHRIPVFDEIKLLKSNLGMLTIPTIKLCDVNPESFKHGYMKKIDLQF